MKPEFFVTTTTQESTVPVTQGGSTYWARIFRMKLPALERGNILLVGANSEVRNDAGYNVEFVGGLTLDPVWINPTQDVTPGGHMLARLNGHNVNSQGHYYCLPEVEAWQAPADIPTAWVSYRVRCRSTAATGGERCTIMPGYGRLWALLWR
jgi:hypothetical protein